MRKPEKTIVTIEEENGVKLEVGGVTVASVCFNEPIEDAKMDRVVNALIAAYAET